MKRILSSCAVVAALLALTGMTQSAAAQSADVPFEACWGQATAVFAQMGDMGEHSSQQSSPRVGLHNLAVILYDAGVISEPSMAALGAFVADALGLSIDACQ